MGTNVCSRLHHSCPLLKGLSRVFGVFSWLSVCVIWLPQQKYQGLGIFLSLKAKQFKIKGPTNLVPGEGPFPRLEIYLVSVKKKRGGDFFSHKATVYQDYSRALITLFNPNFLLKTLSQNIVVWRLYLQQKNFGETQFILSQSQSVYLKENYL